MKFWKQQLVITVNTGGKAFQGVQSPLTANILRQLADHFDTYGVQLIKYPFELVDEPTGEVVCTGDLIETPCLYQVRGTWRTAGAIGEHAYFDQLIEGAWDTVEEIKDAFREKHQETHQDIHISTVDFVRYAEPIKPEPAEVQPS